MKIGVRYFKLEDDKTKLKQKAELCADQLGLIFLEHGPVTLPFNFFGTEHKMHFEQTADIDTLSTYQVSSVQLVTDKKLEAFYKA